MKGLIALLSVLLSALLLLMRQDGPGNSSPSAPTRPHGESGVDDLPLPSSASPPKLSVKDALEQLTLPCPVRLHINESPFRPDRPDYSYRPSDMSEDCPDAIDRLVRAAEPVDAALLRMARGGATLPARYRAAMVLMRRGNPAVVPVFERMAVAPAGEERYLTWYAYTTGVNERLLTGGSISLALRRYGEETDEAVRDQIAHFLGTSRAKQAVPALIAALRRRPDDYSALDALGWIGDGRAVSAIIAAAPEEKVGSNFHIYLHALGGIGTPEAVDFIIANLKNSGAVEALFATRSPRALPALRKHLEALRKSDAPCQIALAATRVSVIRLGSADPRSELLRVAEDGREGH
jgi:HEAT repeat protein